MAKLDDLLADTSFTTARVLLGLSRRGRGREPWVGGGQASVLSSETSSMAWASTACRARSAALPCVPQWLK